MKLKAEANLLLLLCILHLVFDVEVCSPLLIVNHTPKLSLRQRMVKVQGTFARREHKSCPQPNLQGYMRSFNVSGLPQKNYGYLSKVTRIHDLTTLHDSLNASRSPDRRYSFPTSSALRLPCCRCSDRGILYHLSKSKFNPSINTYLPIFKARTCILQTFLYSRKHASPACQTRSYSSSSVMS